MIYLLDTHTLIWAMDDPAKLGDAVIPATKNIDSVLFLSAASIWEIGIKVANKKLDLSLPFEEWIDKAIDLLQLSTLPIRTVDVAKQIELPFHHRDPFDRILAAQALVEGIKIVSNDGIFDDYGVERLWDH